MFEHSQTSSADRYIGTLLLRQTIEYYKWDGDRFRHIRDLCIITISLSPSSLRCQDNFPRVHTIGLQIWYMAWIINIQELIKEQKLFIRRKFSDVFNVVGELFHWRIVRSSLAAIPFTSTPKPAASNDDRDYSKCKSDPEKYRES